MSGEDKVYWNQVVSLGDCAAPCSAPTPCVACTAQNLQGLKKKKTKQEKTMYYDDDGCEMNAVEATLEYLNNRAHNVKTKKFQEEVNFFLPETPAPKNVKELRDAVANGWITVSDEYDGDKSLSYGWMNYILYRDPSKPHDKKGYDAAIVSIKTDFTKAQDAIMVLPAADGLKALNEFESKTYH